MDNVNNVSGKKRGFASMDPEKQREIARKGGKSAHANGTAHQFTTEEARAAGAKGGTTVSQNRQHMSDIGRRGAAARAKVLAKTDAPGGSDGT